jgi:hypothetical protein
MTWSHVQIMDGPHAHAGYTPLRRRFKYSTNLRHVAPSVKLNFAQYIFDQMSKLHLDATITTRSNKTHACGAPYLHVNPCWPVILSHFSLHGQAYLSGG